jgi:hypothetical protein
MVNLRYYKKEIFKLKLNIKLLILILLKKMIIFQKEYYINLIGIGL